MPIFWLAKWILSAGRSAVSLPFRNRSIEIAASWPCATAVMMFFGPSAESPPKNTSGSVDCRVFSPSTGQAPLVELQPAVAFDPREGVFLPDGDQRQIARHGERGRASTDAGHAFARAVFGQGGHQRGHIALQVGGNALHAADRHRFFVHAATAARRFARAIAHAAENARKHIRSPVDLVRFGVTSLRDQAEIFGNRGVRGARPLAIHDLVKMVGTPGICSCHCF